MKNLLLTALLLLIYILLSVFIFSPGMPPTGDEPHYLITAHSLAVDGDLYLLNNYKERQYRIFYPGLLAKRTTLSSDKSQELPAFGPGIAFFLLPFYKIAILLFPASIVPFLRSIMCLVAAVALYHLIRAAEIFSGRPLHVWFLLPAFSLASPLIIYCGMFYPEIVAFLLIVLALRSLFEFRDHPVRSTAMLSILSPAMLWLHPKYLVLSGLLFLITAFRLITSSPRRLRLQLLHLIVTLAGILAFFFFLHEFYGSWSPNRIYGGVQRETSLFDLIRGLGWERIGIMFRMLPAYWLDQRFGIIPYAPIYMMSVPALVWISRNRFREFLPVLVLFLAHFFVISWGAQMGGFAPPSRHFVVLLPFLILPSMLMMDSLGKFQKTLAIILASLGWIISAVILTHYRSIFTNATWRNPDGMSEFWGMLKLSGFIPQLTKGSPDYVLALFWVAGVILFSWLLYPRKPKT